MITCPNCERENADAEKICTYCGTLLVEPLATKKVVDPDSEEGTAKFGTAHFGSRMNLIINLQGETHSFVFDAGTIEELSLGRRNPISGEAPDIDLEKYGAVDKGVSRQHAAIVRRDGKLNIVDKGSQNGTYLNGQRLVAHQPRILRDGDDLRLGHLVLTIKFERESNPFNSTSPT